MSLAYSELMAAHSALPPHTSTTWAVSGDWLERMLGAMVPYRARGWRRHVRRRKASVIAVQPPPLRHFCNRAERRRLSRMLPAERAASWSWIEARPWIEREA